ncbi:MULTISPECIES: hypothetical protein [unclassified Streptomyces]|uniref:hypothetical protein n=1 Tax=unclassified Streptomyces TaxID=2593676 RepID=UPI0016617D3C|nr:MULTISPECIES: hypothetical protein [unclassified Streptomyces]MBD0712240.1 hypothetical protein [Streptomyces sp. CBMA291]MBD0714072.1 hypothetical protein [Streptomyces sp. CBMA370]
MRMRHLGTHARVSLVVAAMAITMTACAQGGSPGPERGGAPAKPVADERVVEGHSYKVDSSPEAAAAFPLNENVFEGTVQSLKPDVHAVDKLDDGSVFEVVYTPVVIKVTTVHKGTLEPGEEVVVRSMGGSADGVTYTTEEAPAKSTFARGTSLFVFGSVLEAVDSENVPAITPHFVYRDSGTTLVDATYASGSQTAPVAKAKVLARLGTER